MSVVIFSLLSIVTPEEGRTRNDEVRNGIFSTVAFALGGATSILSGYLGMQIATYANARTAVEARKGIAPAFMCGEYVRCCRPKRDLAGGVSRCMSVSWVPVSELECRGGGGAASHDGTAVSASGPCHCRRVGHCALRTCEGVCRLTAWVELGAWLSARAAAARTLVALCHVCRWAPWPAGVCASTLVRVPDASAKAGLLGD